MRLQQMCSTKQTLLRGLSPPGSLECLNPLLALLFAVTLKAVLPLWLLNETCQGQGKDLSEVLAELFLNKVRFSQAAISTFVYLG